MIYTRIFQNPFPFEVIAVAWLLRGLLIVAFAERLCIYYLSILFKIEGLILVLILYGFLYL